MNHSGSTPFFGILYSSLRVVPVLVFLFSSFSFSYYYFVFCFECVLRALAITKLMEMDADVLYIPISFPPWQSTDIRSSWVIMEGTLSPSSNFQSKLCHGILDVWSQWKLTSQMKDEAWALSRLSSSYFPTYQ